ncbi:hypothetical protein GCM10023191_067490 [Actinoallomurus oryzae]|uniref:Ig-like domain-containing protein n=1 Tax=Actinoallomurus oryzae TaxID=502180 RepID=A0ABP8QSR6_9ACTN
MAGPSCTDPLHRGDQLRRQGREVLVGVQAYQVRMEVTGPGSAQISYGFSGSDASMPRREKLTWIKRADAGFGFNRLSVSAGDPGTTCRIVVDDEERDRKTVGADGKAECYVSVQND